MKLQKFLDLIEDEEVRIELEIDEPDKNEYQYHYFWLSDFRTSDDIAKYYREYQVVNFGFQEGEEFLFELQITIKK